MQKDPDERFCQTVKQCLRQERMQLGPGCLAELCERLVYCRQCGTQSRIPSIHPEAIQVL